MIGGSGEGFGYHVKQARARPSNISIRDMLSDERYLEHKGRPQQGLIVYSTRASLHRLSFLLSLCCVFPVWQAGGFPSLSCAVIRLRLGR